ncbi:AraC family transcriptional regulator [Porticoccus sp. GXU_MW_L64]
MTLKPEDGRVPTYSFPLILACARELGITAEQALEGTGINSEEVNTKLLFVTFRQAFRLVSNLVKLSPRPDIGLYIGQKYLIAAYGNLGYAMMSCSTWSQAIETGIKYHKCSSSLLFMNLVNNPSNDEMTLVTYPPYPVGNLLPFLVEKLYAGCIAVSEALLGQTAYPKRLEFAYPAPSYVDKYEAAFGVPLLFDQPKNQMIYDRKAMSLPLNTANPIYAKMGEELCKNFLAKHFLGDTLSSKVSNILMKNHGRFPNMTVLANHLDISERTLRRKLMEEGTSYQEIVDQVRARIATEYLQESSLSIERISELVGYTEATNFRRAFKKWTGNPPSFYRN